MVLDWGFILQHTYMFYDAFWLTLEISSIGIILAIIIGFLCALCLSFKPIFFLTRLSALYVEVARNTPLLIQLFSCILGLVKWDYILVHFGVRLLA